MRTTLNLSDALASEARARAAIEGKTFTSFIEEALRERLAKPDASAPASPLPTFGDGAHRLLIDLDDADSLWAVLDEPEARDS
ncbi:type II toxin-antitoxin system VapB family antitoxin [Agromyces laixinhei]|uniref:type II toxin-antitoxin system VapB family antitoxin n=1 Tax=Agromyces laixinhei TaxID=2585717 RepID=UPI001117A1F9|nr:type II toxin-antitoxin system VapB family antitoxin [Agromyces laixinhei]